MELWDVYDGYGNITGVVKTRNDIFDEGEYHIGVSLWIINSKGELLIQKRSPTKRIHPNKWAITSGAVKAGESSSQGCVREAAEEIGIKLKIQDIKLVSRSFGKNTIFDDYVMIKDFSLEEAVLKSDEVSEIKWAGVEQIKELFYSGQFMLGAVQDMDKVIEYINENIFSA